MHNYVFSGKTAVITGVASGIGRALAPRIAHRGSHTALVDRDAEGLQEVAEKIRRAHPAFTVTTHVADLSKIEELPDLAAEIRAQHPRIGLLINNAGVALGGEFSDVSIPEFMNVVNINLLAPVLLTKEFLPDLEAIPESHLVNISSLFGLVAPPGQTAYATSKFGLRGFTLALQAEMIPRGIGITVVHPGGTDTNIARSAPAARGIAPDDSRIEDFRASFQRKLTMPPEAAARLIERAIEFRRERLVTTALGRTADVLSRIMPVKQRGIVARLGV